MTRYEFLDPYLLVKHVQKEKPTPNLLNLREFSLAEAGYDITENLDSSKMEIVIYDNDSNEKIYDDIAFLDLIEIIIIFCKEDQRKAVVARMNSIFAEQNSKFKIQDWMVTLSGRDTLDALIPLLKDDVLKSKLESNRSLSFESQSAQPRASNAAGALQFIFSGDEKDRTKKASEDIAKKISMEWTDEAHAEELEKIISEQVLLAKRMNNEIANIRHTDRSTIQTSGESMFEMIYKINLALIQVSIASDPTRYIENRKAIEIKTDYSLRYSIDLQKYTEVFDDEDDDGPIDLSGIQF